MCSWTWTLSQRAATTSRARRPQARRRGRSRWSSSDLHPACSCVAETESMATVCLPQPAICVRRSRTTATGRRWGEEGVALGPRGGSCLGGKAGYRDGPPKVPRQKCVIVVVGIRGFACPTLRVCGVGCFTYRTDQRAENRTRNSPCVAGSPRGASMDDGRYAATPARSARADQQRSRCSTCHTRLWIP